MYNDIEEKKKPRQTRLAILVLLLVVVLVALLRPDLLSLSKVEEGVSAVRSLVSGEPSTSKVDVGKEAAPEKKDMYRIDLKTGGRVYTDNLKRSDGTFTYTTKNGMVVAIEGHEVIGLVKYKEGEEPQD